MKQDRIIGESLAENCSDNMNMGKSISFLMFVTDMCVWFLKLLQGDGWQWRSQKLSINSFDQRKYCFLRKCFLVCSYFASLLRSESRVCQSREAIKGVWNIAKIGLQSCKTMFLWRLWKILLPREVSSLFFSITFQNRNCWTRFCIPCAWILFDPWTKTIRIKNIHVLYDLGTNKNTEDIFLALKMNNSRFYSRGWDTV